MTTTRILTMFLMLLGGFCAYAQSLGKVISAPGTHAQIIVHTNYTSAFNPDTKTPDWVSWSIEKEDISGDISLYARSVDEIEEMTGMDFFSELPDEIENTIESAYDLSFWPHARH